MRGYSGATEVERQPWRDRAPYVAYKVRQGALSVEFVVGAMALAMGVDPVAVGTYHLDRARLMKQAKR